jgi:hypothetical protein
MDEDKYVRNWEILKPLLLAKWSKLKSSDLEGIHPTRGEIVKLIRSKYKDWPEQSIIQDLENTDQQILKNP